MCGIAGSINHSLDIPLLTKQMFHRGPDEQTTFEDRNLQLHHHRLSILDIAGGKQPMHYEHLTIIFNGQVYNHLDVRAKYNLVCKTNSDTETILQAYAKAGSNCLTGCLPWQSMIEIKGSFFWRETVLERNPCIIFQMQENCFLQAN